MNADQSVIHPELKRLIALALDTATSNLEGGETFLPGSFSIDDAGKYILAVAAQSGAEGSNMLVTVLRERAAARRLRAAALYRDVRVRPKGASEDVDAVHVVAELASGEAIHVFQVYRRNAAGQVVLGESETAPAPSAIFGESTRGADRAKRWWAFWK